MKCAASVIFPASLAVTVALGLLASQFVPSRKSERGDARTSDLIRAHAATVSRKGGNSSRERDTRGSWGSVIDVRGLFSGNANAGRRPGHRAPHQPAQQRHATTAARAPEDAPLPRPRGLPPVPLPKGSFDGRIFHAGTAAGRARDEKKNRLRPECVTIVHVENRINASLMTGLDAEGIAALAVANPSLVAVHLAVVASYLYARRHGHAFRVVVLEGDSVVFGPGRPERHPVWAIVALLHSAWHGGVGAELLHSPRCGEGDRWIQMLDTDVVVASTGFSIGEIVEAYRAGGRFRSKLPCDGFAPGFYSTPDEARSDGETPGVCHYGDRLGTRDARLASGVDPDGDVIFAGFEDPSGWNDGRCSAGKNTTGCSEAVLSALNTGNLLVRVPRTSPADRPSRLLTVARRMLRVWRGSRLTRNDGAGKEGDYLQTGWGSDPIRNPKAVVFGRHANNCSRQDYRCGYASEQPVFNRAVLWGLPHRPFRADDPDLASAGRFTRHFAIHTCDKACFKHNDVDSFLHFTGNYWPPNIPWARVTGMMRALFEYHGLTLYLPFSAAARRANVFSPLHDRNIRFRFARHADSENQRELDEWARSCHRSKGVGCPVDAALADRSAEVVDETLRGLASNGHMLSLRLSPRSRGVGASDGGPWYDLVDVGARGA